MWCEGRWHTQMKGHQISPQSVLVTNTAKKQHDDEKRSPLGDRSACKRKPIGLDGLGLYCQLKQEKQQRTCFVLFWNCPIRWGRFTVPVAERRYVCNIPFYQSWFSWSASGGSRRVSLIRREWMRKTDFTTASNQAPALEAESLQVPLSERESTSAVVWLKYRDAT